MSASLRDVARKSDRAVAQARAELVRAVRQAARNGMTQAQIGAEIGRSQPEVSRLLRFHGTTPLGRTLRSHAPEIRRLVAECGGADVRVFGSLATGLDHSSSDIDLLFTMREPLSLLQLGALEAKIASLVEAHVDLVPESALRPEFRERVLTEAVPL